MGGHESLYPVGPSDGATDLALRRDVPTALCGRPDADVPRIAIITTVEQAVHHVLIVFHALE